MLAAAVVSRGAGRHGVGQYYTIERRTDVRAFKVLTSRSVAVSYNYSTEW
jgi:hypothetical protein